MTVQESACVALPEPEASYWNYLGPIIGLLGVIIILIVVLLRVKLLRFKRYHRHSKRKNHPQISTFPRVHQVMTSDEIPADLDLNSGLTAEWGRTSIRLPQRDQQTIIKTKDGHCTLKDNKSAQRRHSHRYAHGNRKQRASKETELIENSLNNCI